MLAVTRMARTAET